MIETIENGIQLALIAVCLTLAALYVVREKNLKGGLLILFYSSYLLGDLYWLLYLLFYGDTPVIFYIPDLSWYAAYVFLYLMLQRFSPKEEREASCPLAGLVLLFTCGNGIYYIAWYIVNGSSGGYISTVISTIMMSFLMIHSVRGLFFIRSHPEALPRRMLYAITLVFCIIEYCAWTSSCIWDGDTLANPYIWFDGMLALSLVFFLPAFRKAVKA